jgi:hypothetical protein
MSDTIKMSKKKLLKEHKNLVKVLKSPSHKDDLEEAKKQELEMKEYKRRS